MLSRLLKPHNIACILCYIIFMALAFNSKIVDALVLYVSEKNGKTVYVTKKKEIVAVSGQEKSQKPLIAIKYDTKTYDLNDESADSNLKGLEDNDGKELEKSEEDSAEIPQNINDEDDKDSSIDNNKKEIENSNTTNNQDELMLESTVVKNPINEIKEVSIQKKVSSSDDNTPASAKAYIDSIYKNKWKYTECSDRYIVDYDDDTYIVLTIKPSLQKMLENILAKYNTRISAAIIENPYTGEILAVASSHKNKVLNIESDDFKDKNWAFKSTFPVASIFKIITASAGIDTGKITSNSNFLAYKKSYMKVWKAFANSHNGVFGSVAQKTGRDVVNKYASAFGFNKPFFFDLPVGKSICNLSTTNAQMRQDAAGLNKDFLVSPMHVASIVSTILNRGKTLKPYLVDYVVKKGRVVFKRRPFQLAQPIKESTAREIYKMMYATTAVGTGKKGFGGYKKCPTLAKICGGKTGTLTGSSPNYLYTWFGGFTKATGRDLCIVTLSGQKDHLGTKAASIAGQIAYELYMKYQESTENVASN